MGASCHRMAYRRHFEGYTEFRNEAGKIQRVYTAEWIVDPLPPRERKRRNAFHSVFMVTGLLLWICISASSLPGLESKWVSLLIAAAIPALFFSVISLVSTFSCASQMTRNEYHDGPQRLKDASLAAGMIIACTAPASFISGLIVAEQFSSRILIAPVCYLLSFWTFLMIYIPEHKTAYLRRENENALLAEMEDAAEIDV